MPDVLARVETVRPGDRVFTVRCPEQGYEVEAVETYDDAAIVVIYRTGRSSAHRFGDTVYRTENVLQSIAAMRAGERLRVRRGGPSRPAAPPRPSAS